MANSSDGLSYDQTTPVSANPRKDGPAEILGIRKGMKLRLDKEHVALATMSAGPDLATGGGEHRLGSARAYITSTEPTNRPDGQTLASADNGRLWVDTTTGHVMKIYDGSNFQNVGGVEQASGSETVATIAAAATTVTVGFIPDLFMFMFGTDGSQFHSKVFSIASVDPAHIVYYTTVSTAILSFTMNSTDVDIELQSETNDFFSNGAICYWRALKF